MSGRPHPDGLEDLGLLAATLLHELRQPVFAVKALAQIARGDCDGAAGERLDRLLAQVEHMEALLELYGTLGGRRPSPRVFDLGAQIQAAVDLVAPRRARIGATVDLVLPGEPLPVRGGALAARQVVVNLLHNALDAVATVEPRKVDVRAVLVDGVVLLEVRDSGPGIPPEVASQLFDPFFSDKADGVGLGLYIARRVVEGAGGTLVVTGDPEGGAIARVRWPRVE